MSGAPPPRRRRARPGASAASARRRSGARHARGSFRRPRPRRPRSAAGPVTGFLASCWAELKRVQWPDRDTLVQASAVTLIFVMVMAAYLGALDAAFNWIIQRII